MENIINIRNNFAIFLIEYDYGSSKELTFNSENSKKYLSSDDAMSINTYIIHIHI